MNVLLQFDVDQMQYLFFHSFNEISRVFFFWHFFKALYLLSNLPLTYYAFVMLVLYFGLTVSKYTDLKINLCKKQLLAYFLMYTTTVNSLNRISISMAPSEFIYLLVVYLNATTEKKKMHANNSIFCSDFLSHTQPL